MRQETRAHGLHQEQALVASQRHEVAGFGCVHRERLLDEHRLAGLERQAHVGVVHRVRCGDVDDVDLGVCNQLLIAPVPVGDREAVGEAVRRIELPRPHRDDRSGFGQPEILGERGRYSAGTDEAPAQWLAQLVTVAADSLPRGAAFTTGTLAHRSRGARPHRIVAPLARRAALANAEDQLEHQLVGGLVVAAFAAREQG